MHREGTAGKLLYANAYCEHDSKAQRQTEQKCEAQGQAHKEPGN